MKRFTVLTFTFVTMAVLTLDVEAGCKSRGYGHGFSGPSFHHRIQHHRPHHHQIYPHVYRPRVVVRSVPSFPTTVQSVPQGQPIAPPPLAGAQQPPQQPAIQQTPATGGNLNGTNATNPELNALQLLGGNGQSAEAPASATGLWGTDNSQPATHIGNWTASLPNQAQVQLQLLADGRFSWLAETNGKQSRFDGRFTLDGNTLTLTRTTDNQKLAGTLTFGANGFNFKLVGAKDSGLNFTRPT